MVAVGSTCTIVADLFRRDGLTPAPGLAGLMMAEGAAAQQPHFLTIGMKD